MRPNLPSRIGAELVLLVHSPEVLRWLNWHGFQVFCGDGSAMRLRRRCPPGAMTSEAEPYCPAGTRRLIMPA